MKYMHKKIRYWICNACGKLWEAKDTERQYVCPYCGSMDIG